MILKILFIWVELESERDRSMEALERAMRLFSGQTMNDLSNDLVFGYFRLNKRDTRGQFSLVVG